MIKNIIFDFGCVLVDLDKQRCVETFKSIGAESISAYVDECRQEDLFHDLETGKTGIGAARLRHARPTTRRYARRGTVC